MTEQFDVIVMGAGSGGENLAGDLADRGWKVAAIEQHRVGGECPFVACVPSKAMLHDALAGRSFEDAVARRDEVVHGFDDGPHADGLTDKGVELVRGRGTITAPGEVTVGDRVVRGTHIVIATGSGHNELPVPGLDEVAPWDSDAVWSTYERPSSMVVVGAGAVGCEIATAFAAFGTEVTLVNRSDAVLTSETDEVTGTVQEALRRHGVELRLGAEVTGVKPDPEGALVELSDGSSLTTAKLVTAIGKTPRLAGIGLDAIGIDEDDFTVARNGRVAGTDGVWAVGDVTGYPAYTHVANAMADVVAHEIDRELRDDADGEHRELHVEHLPRCVFTDPPFAACGTVAADEDDVLVARASYDDIARPFTDGTDLGEAVLAVDRNTRKVLGFAAVGATMDEVVGMLAVAIRCGISVDELGRVVQPFPTHAEIVKLLAERAVGELG